MNNALLKHALDNVWCNPGQDRQFVWKLVNLRPTYSIRNELLTAYERVPLPTKGEYYHVYQIGKMNPVLLGIPNIVRRWMSLAYLMKEHRLFSDLYTISGIQFPRGHAFVWFTPTGNMIISVKENRRIEALYGKDLYLRVYSNAFFQTDRDDGRRDIIHRQITVTDTNQVLLFQREIADILDEKGGYPFYFVNGRFVNNISIVTAGENDIAEFILDPSIKRMVEFDITNQPTFHSELDKMNKYILHYTDDSVDTIEYMDDVDAYMIDSFSTTRFMGIHYHKNHRAWLRMLTHKDYTVPVSRFMEFVETHQTDPRYQLDPVKWREDKWTTPVGKKLRLYIRDSGYDRPLIAEANRIQELYRLGKRDIIRAFLETHGTVDVWKAANLEMSSYVKLMGMTMTELFPEMFNIDDVPTERKQELEELVGDAYGYHAVTKLLADTPSKVYTDSGRRYADLAHEHQNNATIFEYDEDGLLINYHYHTSGRRWFVVSDDCVLVEAMVGRGHFRAKTVEGTSDVPIPLGFNYRIYIKEKQFNTIVGEWIDITQRDDRHEWGFFDDVASIWRWTKPTNQFHGALRIDNEFLCYRLDLTKSDGHLRFSIEHETMNTNGNWGSETVEIPYGQLDVFMNGRQLAESIDYQVIWPEIVVNNIEYLSNDDLQEFVIRLHGFADTPTDRINNSELGYVRHGVLSNNDRFDIHSNKIRRIVVDGRYLHRDDVVFDEEEKNYVIDKVRNGVPYFIQTPPVTLRDVYPRDYLARKKDDEIDLQVSNFLTEHYGLRQYTDPNYITRKYQVISVFANKLLHDLRVGWFYPPGIEGNYSHHEVRQWCAPYEWLLPYDLCNQEYDTFHLNIRPHWEERPVAIDAFKYKLFHHALETYLRYPPDLSPYVLIS